MKIDVRPYQAGEERYVAELHEHLYQEEYGWGPAFIDYATDIALRFPERKASDREELFIAERDGRPAGCIMLCQTEDPAVGQLRLFAVEKTNGVAEWARLC